MSERSLILIGGPTASGKSALALRLAVERHGSVINADAMQVYAGLPLLTAQPDAQDRATVPHYLYEVTDPAEASSAGKWLALARDAIANVRAGGRVPILVGGTGLYFDALMGGLADIPSIPDDARARALALYEEAGEEKFRALLSVRDPESASRIARNDRQRLIRAYEVVEHTGKALGEWHRMSLKDGTSRSDKEAVEYHLLIPPRDVLYAACDKRFLGMIERGAIDEVKGVMARHLSDNLPAMKIIGVREIASYLRGEIGLSEAIARAQQLTRNYAKRQMTWFRNRWAKDRG